jgi:CheY-like chemotaxis protein/HAMP domain-containing protein
VAREVGTEGKLGGQAAVPGVAGVWKDLTDNVNLMASNLTDQVRGIAKVVTAVANGDLKQKLSVVAKGEIAELANTINSMIDTLATFGAQVTNVAREVGVEGRLGGQANVPGAAGTWKDLTDNVNQLANNLTTQVRAIAEVATAVAKGDLSRTIQVETSGELEELKNNINEMIRNLRETSGRNSEQDWLKTNLAQFTRMLQGQRDLLNVSQMVLNELVTVVNAQHGVFYMMEENGHGKQLRLVSSYAYKERKSLSNIFRLGEGLVGQCAVEKQRILITNAPEDYIRISSGLGEARPNNIIVLPVLFEGEVKAVMELASFNQFSPTHQTFLEQLTESIGIMINTIEANMRTESLLAQSQSLARELQSQQEELRQTNEELEDKARLLEEQKTEVEAKKLEVEQAKRALEDKAEQLAITSKYKSEFLATMSHELRTPLNSLLILSQQLAENRDGNLMPRQVEYAQTIFTSGNDLLSLINDILDLAKIESGTVTVDAADIHFDDLRETMERIFRPVAESKRLEFAIVMDPDLPKVIHTDGKRLEQVLKNLLANAFKFTERGTVTLRMETVKRGWSSLVPSLARAESVIGFSVTDTGIGIAADKQKIIFEAFQQADSGTTRRFGGTGLGLNISREITNLLGGELKVTESVVGRGSTFTLYLPNSYQTAPSIGTTRRLDTPLPQVIDMPTPVISTPVVKPPTRPLTPPPSVSVPGKGFEDDAENIKPGDRIILIVEDDLTFARILLEMAHEQNLKAVIATSGEAAHALARQYRPDAITLDIALPDVDGWTLLEQLKNHPMTRQIPVHVISIHPADDVDTSALGAHSYLMKSANKDDLATIFQQIEAYVVRPRKLLIVEDNDIAREVVKELFDDGIEVTAVATGEEALELMRNQSFDCLILDLRLPGMSGMELVEKIQDELNLRELPIIIHTAKSLTDDEQRWFNTRASSVVMKDIASPQRLLADTQTFLRNVAAAPVPDLVWQAETPKGENVDDEDLSGKKMLIVDDDIRNIFALTSILERHNIQVFSAENGRDALDLLRRNPDIHLVLMDIMMPEMDGYETMQEIRRMPRFVSLPIIALTAKAMKGDREKCIEAGASDYMAKPVDVDQLVTLLKQWIHQSNRIS